MYVDHCRQLLEAFRPMNFPIIVFGLVMVCPVVYGLELFSTIRTSVLWLF